MPEAFSQQLVETANIDGYSLKVSAGQICGTDVGGSEAPFACRQSFCHTEQFIAASSANNS
jgi:hypothetical protein